MTHSGCGGCDADPGRRAFLRDMAALVAGVAGGLGRAPNRAVAWPIAFATGRPVRGSETAYAVPAGDGATIDKDHEVILARYQQSVYAFALSCPHQKTPLRWQAEDHMFRCPKHKSRFQPDGVFVDGRATRSMDRYAIRREGNEVWVSLDKLYREDENRAAWIAAGVHL